MCLKAKTFLTNENNCKTFLVCDITEEVQNF